MTLPIVWAVLIALVCAAVAGAACFYAGMTYRRKTAEQKIGSAEEEARRLVNDAVKAAQQKRKEALVEVKDAALQMKAEADKEIKDRRNELSRQERRLDQKEEALDKRVAAFEQKEEEQPCADGISSPQKNTENFSRSCRMPDAAADVLQKNRMSLLREMLSPPEKLRSWLPVPTRWWRCFSAGGSPDGAADLSSMPGRRLSAKNRCSGAVWWDAGA